MNVHSNSTYNEKQILRKTDVSVETCFTKRRWKNFNILSTTHTLRARRAFFENLTTIQRTKSLLYDGSVTW
jgi:hypothetical protein